MPAPAGRESRSVGDQPPSGERVAQPIRSGGIGQRERQFQAAFLVTHTAKRALARKRFRYRGEQWKEIALRPAARARA